MEGGLVHQVMGGRSNVNNKVIKKKNVKRRSFTTTTIRKEFPICATLQELYSTCKKVFKGPGCGVPSPQDVHSLSTILDRMKPEDFCLGEDHQFFTPGDCVVKYPRVTLYTTVYTCLNFSLVLFFLPSSAVIPLHNHPDMTVFSKLLRGTMHIKAYDWVDPEDRTQQLEQPSSLVRLAKLKTNAVFTAPCSTKVLYPTSGGNIHAFTAITPCAILDVIGPPYSKQDGRDCTYYKDNIYTSPEGKFTKIKDEEQSYYAWLEEIDKPEHSKMDGIQYRGPRVIETAN